MAEPRNSLLQPAAPRPPGHHRLGADQLSVRRVARRSPGSDDPQRHLGPANDVATLGRDIIHSVINPIDRLTGAIHIYGGQFFSQPRREWDPETLREGAYDVNKTLRLFEE